MHFDLRRTVSLSAIPGGFGPSAFRAYRSTSADAKLANRTVDLGSPTLGVPPEPGSRRESAATGCESSVV